jgi:hypothetical protein
MFPRRRLSDVHPARGMVVVPTPLVVTSHPPTASVTVPTDKFECPFPPPFPSLPFPSLPCPPIEREEVGAAAIDRRQMHRILIYGISACSMPRRDKQSTGHRSLLGRYEIWIVQLADYENRHVEECALMLKAQYRLK